MIIDIKNFVLSGKFGSFGIGASKSDVLTTLGEPDDGADHGETGTEIIYAWYELFFDLEEKLFAIQIDNYDPSDEDSYSYKNEKFRIEPWLMKTPNAPTFLEVANQLKSELIEFEIIEFYERHQMVLKSGVVIDFHEEPETLEERELLGFRYWPTFNT